MSEWLERQKKSSSSIRKFLKERIEKASPRRKLSAEESKRFHKLENIADKLKRGENVQNRQLQTWLNEDEYKQLVYEWQEQLVLREELKSKPSDLKRYEEKLNKLPSTAIVQKATVAKASTLLQRSSTTRVKVFARMHWRYCKKFCTMTAVFAFGLIGMLALKLVGT